MVGVLLATVLCSGCLPIHRFAVDAPFTGLGAKLTETSQNHGTLRLLVVHGMGIQTQGYSLPLITGIASRAHLIPTGPRKPVAISQGPYFYGTLNIQPYSSGARKLTVYELTWSPTTAWIKDFQFQTDIQDGRYRQLVNKALKQSLLDESLSDAVLYAGKFRSQMQFPIEYALNTIGCDGFGQGDQLAVVTFSLGSYMFFDTLARMTLQTFGTNATTHGKSLDQLAAHTTQIYMLANQLPLLELSDLECPPQAKLPTSASGAPRVLQQFLQQKQAAAGRLAPLPPELSKLQVVAFSDPNDLLSYTLNPANFPTDHSTLTVQPANVSMIVARWSILGIAANPLAAHTDWKNDSHGIDLLTFGYPSQPCP